MSQLVSTHNCGQLNCPCSGSIGIDKQILLSDDKLHFTLNLDLILAMEFESS